MQSQSLGYRPKTPLIYCRDKRKIGKQKPTISFPYNLQNVSDSLSSHQYIHTVLVQVHKVCSIPACFQEEPETKRIEKLKTAQQDKYKQKEASNSRMEPAKREGKKLLTCTIVAIPTESMAVKVTAAAAAAASLPCYLSSLLLPLPLFTFFSVAIFKYGFSNNLNKYQHNIRCTYSSRLGSYSLS